MKARIYWINPARPQLVITLELLKDLLCGILDLGFWEGENGKGVTCIGFWGLGREWKECHMTGNGKEMEGAWLKVCDPRRGLEKDSWYTDILFCKALWGASARARQ